MRHICVLVSPELDRSLEKQIVLIVVLVVRKAYHIIILALFFLEEVAMLALKFSLNANLRFGKKRQILPLQIYTSCAPLPFTISPMT